MKEGMLIFLAYLITIYRTNPNFDLKKILNSFLTNKPGILKIDHRHRCRHLSCWLKKWANPKFQRMISSSRSWGARWWWRTSGPGRRRGGRSSSCRFKELAPKLFREILCHTNFLNWVGWESRVIDSKKNYKARECSTSMKISDSIQLTFFSNWRIKLKYNNLKFKRLDSFIFLLIFR